MISELLPPKIVEYCWIDTNSKKFIENAQQSYQKISAPSWPKVETIEDLMNLPNNIKQECKTHAFNPWMYLSENIDQQEWQNYTGGEITPDYLARFKYMLQDNIEYIKDQTIVDLAGNSGAESFCCMKLGAKSVTLAEARSELVDKAKNILVEMIDRYVDEYKYLRAFTYNSGVNQNERIALQILGNLNQIISIHKLSNNKFDYFEKVLP